MMSEAAAAATNAVNEKFAEASASTSGDDLGKEDFLLLLVTQFQYQDPLNPMEDKEFIAQLSQFSSLEQLMNLNTSMNGLTAATLEDQMLNATAFIGKTVIAYGESVSLEDGKASRYQYALGETIASGVINIIDSDRAIVYTETVGAKSAGAHDFEWNGKNMLGEVQPDGVYTVGHSFLNKEGKVTIADRQVEGTVKTIATNGAKLSLILNDGREMYLEGVRKVSAIIDEGNTPDEDTTPPEDGGSTGDKVDKALAQLDDTMQDARAKIDTVLKDGSLNATEMKEKADKEYNEAKKEIRAWADKALKDGTHTIAEVRTTVEQKFKEFNNYFNQ